MTGAGSASVAFTVEDTFRDLPTSPTWYEPGKNIQIGDASLQNALERARQPDDPRPAGSREGNLEGALSVTFTMTDTNFHDLVFADSGTALASSGTLAPSATWYLASDVAGGSQQERFLEGAAVESVSWEYQQGNDVTVQLTIIYTDEFDGSDADAPSTPAAINQPTKDDIVPWHGTSFQLDAAEVNKLQQLSLSVSGMARPRRGQSRYIQDFVVGAYQPSLSVTAILEDDRQRSLWYGGSSATTTQDEIDETPGTLAFDNPAGNVSTYTLSGLQPNDGSWDNLVSADEDVTDPTNYHVRDIQTA